MEALAGLRRCGGGAVEIDVFPAAVVGPHADDVALVGHDVDQLELPVETADGGVALANFLSCFDGKAERRSGGKLEADDGMCDPRRAPVVDGKVNAGDLRN